MVAPVFRSAAHLRNGNAAAGLADGDKCLAMRPNWAKAYSIKVWGLTKYVLDIAEIGALDIC